MWQDELQLAVSIARQAGEILNGYFRGDIHARLKGPGDVVTRADKESEAFIRERILEAYPTHAFLGEEDGLSGESDYVWVVDPLDGTLNFARGLPAYVVSIGLLHERSPVVGVIYDPIHDETYAAVKGEGATLDGAPLICPDEPLSATSLIALPSSYKNVGPPPYVGRVLSRCRWRDLGCASLHICLVARGTFACAVFEKTKLWDIAAAAIIATESGAAQLNLDGTEMFPLREPWEYYCASNFPSLTVAPGAKEIALKEIFRV